MKIYEMEKQEDGSVKVVSELNPEEMKAVLTLGLMNLFMNGLAPTSMAHHFAECEVVDPNEVEVTAEDDGSLAMLDVTTATKQ